MYQLGQLLLRHFAAVRSSFTLFHILTPCNVKLASCEANFILSLLKGDVKKKPLLSCPLTKAENKNTEAERNSFPRPAFYGVRVNGGKRLGRVR